LLGPITRDTVVTYMVKPIRTTSSDATPLPPRDGARWLLLIHQIPPKPDYLRVKIGRRLQRIGSVAIKNSVYALPASAEAYEDFQWIVREIEEGGGDAFISEASLGDGLTDAAVRAKFDAARNEEYAEILAGVKSVLNALTAPAGKSGKSKPKVKPARRQPVAEHELAKLRRRFEATSALDFFAASEQAKVSAALDDIESRIGRNAAAARDKRQSRPIDGATWVTRRDVHVDRVASAWLIRRFVDRRPQFKFVDATRHVHRDGELRFDMFEAEYTHVGDACTFEALASMFVPDDAALREVGEIVHDIDCKDAKFRRDEAAGLARFIAGLVTQHAKDEDRVEHGAVLFDTLYASFRTPTSK
jgi:hypothetical protein